MDGFSALGWSRWFADWHSAGIDLLREARPDLHARVTSTSWSKMDAFFVNEIRNNINAAKANGLIPWTGMQAVAQVSSNHTLLASLAFAHKGTPNPEPLR